MPIRKSSRKRHIKSRKEAQLRARASELTYLLEEKRKELVLDSAQYQIQRRLQRIRFGVVVLLTNVVLLPFELKSERGSSVFYTIYGWGPVGLYFLLQAWRYRRGVRYVRERCKVRSWYIRFLKSGILVDSLMIALVAGAVLYLTKVDVLVGGGIEWITRIAPGPSHVIGQIVSWVASGFVGNIFYEFVKRRLGLFRPEKDSPRSSP